MTAWDAERFIAEALASAQAQTLPLDEVVVVDDGSTDGTAEVAAGFAGVRVLRRDHEGIGRARNAGIAATTGELVCFLDADDVWSPTKVERQVAAFAAEPTLECTFCHFDEFVDPSASEAAVATRPPKTGVGGALVSTAMLRRSLIERLGPFSASTTGEWVEWWAVARSAGVHEVTLPDVLVRRRIHDANNSAQQSIAGHAAFLAAARAHRRGRAQP
jgi:glycosyltransferase involved in cell wall biosynthesis